MGTTEAHITNTMQRMEKRISGVEDTIENIESLVKKPLNPTNS